MSDDAPVASAKRVALRVTKDALRQIRGGHPWVFDRSITSVSHEGQSGDLAVVFDTNREFAAIGLYDPRSPIRVRILHHGKPVSIDRAFWSRRLAAAIDRRAAVTNAGDTTGYRVVHGENDGFPGLVLDRYANTFVVKLYSAAWLPHLAALTDVTREQLPVESMIVRFSRELRAADLRGLREGDAIVGAAPLSPVRFHEHGLTFEADLVNGQKTGHFLDQRDNRNRVRAYTKGLSVLDVFACTGGFSVFAAAGGATSVHSVDLGAPALDTARRNMAHNTFIANVRNCRHTTQTGDAFTVMEQLAGRGQRFDVVIVDPPSFARKRADRERALHAYGRLTRLALAIVERNGLLVQSSCSSRVSADDFFAGIHANATSTHHSLSELLRTTHASDHPIGFDEGAYLKTLFARVTG